MSMARRELLQRGGILALAAALPGLAQAQPSGSSQGSSQGAADHTIRIGNGLVELAPDRIISTTTYNGQFPGPLLRFKQGQQVVIDIVNDTDTPEQLHWHGQTIAADVRRCSRRRHAVHCGPGRPPYFVQAGSVGAAFLPYTSHTWSRSLGRAVWRPGWHRLCAVKRRSRSIRPRSLSHAQGIPAGAQPRRRHGDGFSGACDSGEGARRSRRVCHARIAGQGNAARL